LNLSDRANGERPPWSASDAEVAAFVARYGTKYEQATDKYSVEDAYAEPVKAGKNTPLYNAHSYHTKVPPQGIVPYLEHYTQSGDIVLDPFCGSGMTGVACILTGRRAILNDLSPAATHIAYNYCTPVDVVALEQAWERVKTSVENEFAVLYATKCDRCGGDATIQYTVWSDVYGCETCGDDLLLWDLAVVRERKAARYDPPLSTDAPVSTWRPILSTEIDKPAGTVLEQFACPRCRSVWRKAQVQRRRSDPVLTAYDCRRCRPGRGAHPATPAEKALVKQIESEPIPFWHPTTPFDESREMWRGGHRDAGIVDVSQFWTTRTLRALSHLWKVAGEQQPPRVAAAVRFLVTSGFPRLARTTRYLFGKGGNSGISGTLYVGAFTAENNPIALLNRKYADVVAAFAQLANAPYQAVLTTLHAGQDIGIEAESIDYIFTDPPFGANIFYADCSLLWEAWLGYFTDEQYEAVWNKSRKRVDGGKTLADYQLLMTQAFREMHRVLKPGRWASVVFHNSDDRVWNAIRDAAADAGFTLENAVAFDKEQRSFKGVKGDKGEERVTNFDIVLNLRKARVAGTLPPLDGSATDVQERVLPLIDRHLRRLGPGTTEGSTSESEQRTTQFIHSVVIRELMPSHQSVAGVSYAAVEETLRQFCQQVDGRWYLPGDPLRETSLTIATQLALMPEVRDEASAIAWLRSQLQTGPKLEGDLVTEFQLASVRARLAKPFRQILEENFSFDDRRGRWRLPSAQELDRKMDVVRAALQRRVTAYLTRPDAPPASLESWFRECYRRELFSEAHALFRHISRDAVGEGTYAELRKLDRVAALRTGVTPEQVPLPLRD
jgi:DNA modification methylase